MKESAALKAEQQTEGELVEVLKDLITNHENLLLLEGEHKSPGNDCTELRVVIRGVSASMGQFDKVLKSFIALCDMQKTIRYFRRFDWRVERDPFVHFGYVTYERQGLVPVQVRFFNSVESAVSGVTGVLYSEL